MFEQIDECTMNIECKLPAWSNVLEKKKCRLEDELRWYRGTFGRIYDYGEKYYPTNYFRSNEIYKYHNFISLDIFSFSLHNLIILSFIRINKCFSLQI